MMKKGYFAHRLCFRNRLLDKHILYLSCEDHRIKAVQPFQQEVSLTVFCEGILFPVSCGFETQERLFVETLQQQLDADAALSVGEALLANAIYTACMAAEGETCRLYALTSVDWLTGRLPQSGKVEVMRVV